MAKIAILQIIPSMVISDASSTISFIESVWQIVSGVLRLNPEAYRAVFSAPNGWRLALFILLLASLSYTVGQVVVLFANRVNRKHFIPGLASSALTLVVSAFFWAVSIWFTAKVIYDVQQPMLQVFSAVAISFAPLLFGFMILAPYLGNIIFYILRIWVFLAVIVGTTVTFQFGFWQALLCSALGWIVFELLTRLPFLQIRRISNWLWRLSTGTEKPLGPDEIVTQFVDESKLSAKKGNES